MNHFEQGLSVSPNAEKPVQRESVPSKSSKWKNLAGAALMATTFSEAATVQATPIESGAPQEQRFVKKASSPEAYRKDSTLSFKEMKNEVGVAFSGTLKDGRSFKFFKTREGDDYKKDATAVNPCPDFRFFLDGKEMKVLDCETYLDGGSHRFFVTASSPSEKSLSEKEPLEGFSFWFTERGKYLKGEEQLIQHEQANKQSAQPSPLRYEAEQMLPQYAEGTWGVRYYEPGKKYNYSYDTKKSGKSMTYQFLELKNTDIYFGRQGK